MYNNRGNRPIAPELVAAKLEKVKNFEAPSIARELEAQPRFAEMLWFLQWVSNSENYPGGIHRFAVDLINESGELLGTEEMLEIGPVKKYSRQQQEKIDAGMPVDTSKQRRKYYKRLAGIFDGATDAAQEEDEAPILKGHAEYLEQCRAEAENHLDEFLFDLCEKSDVFFTRPAMNEAVAEVTQRAPWYFPYVCDAILAFMDRRKALIADMIGETAITREISKWLEVARHAKRCVLIIGTERFGKTESVKNWCLQNPGLVRLVATPDSNATDDLLREVARALGIQASPSARGHKLREMIDYVLVHSGLMLVFDECQFLLPGNYSRTPAASRLNWFRRRIMDKGIPSALVATPQSYKPAKDRFVKKTGYAIGQFDERILKTVSLPAELPHDDLLSIARIHFPSLAQPYLEYVVTTTVATERNYVSDIEKIATLARVSADQAGRKAPALADIESAIADVLSPTDPAHVAAAPVDATHRPALCKRRAQPVQDDCTALPRTARCASLNPDFSSHNRTETLSELPG